MRKDKWQNQSPTQLVWCYVNNKECLHLGEPQKDSTSPVVGISSCLAFAPVSLWSQFGVTTGKCPHHEWLLEIRNLGVFCNISQKDWTFSHFQKLWAKFSPLSKWRCVGTGRWIKANHPVIVQSPFWFPLLFYIQWTFLWTHRPPERDASDLSVIKRILNKSPAQTPAWASQRTHEYSSCTAVVPQSFALSSVRTKSAFYSLLWFCVWLPDPTRPLMLPWQQDLHPSDMCTFSPLGKLSAGTDWGCQFGSILLHCISNPAVSYCVFSPLVRRAPKSHLSLFFCLMNPSCTIFES